MELTVEPYVSRTDAELEQLAQDIVDGKVFHTFYHSQQIVDSGLPLTSIFLPLLFVETGYADWVEANDIYTWYEYLSEASPRTCNGMPMFFSVCVMSKADTERLHVRVKEIATFKQERLNNAKSS